MHPRFDSLSKELAERSPLDIDGTPFALSLVSIIEDAVGRNVAVVTLAADHGHEHHRGELHISLDTLARPDLAKTAVDTMERIIRGDLPPGARELL